MAVDFEVSRHLRKVKRKRKRRKESRGMSVDEVLNSMILVEEFFSLG